MSVNENINSNLKNKLDEFPEEVRSISIDIIEKLNSSNASKESIEEMIMLKVNSLVAKGV